MYLFVNIFPFETHRICSSLLPKCTGVHTAELLHIVSQGFPFFGNLGSPHTPLPKVRKKRPFGGAQLRQETVGRV